MKEPSLSDKVGELLDQYVSAVKKIDANLEDYNEKDQARLRSVVKRTYVTVILGIYEKYPKELK
jgi:hypothetical protein